MKNILELEQEITKISMAMMARNRDILADIIIDLEIRMPLEEAAGVLLLSLERLLWFEPDLTRWIIENVIPLRMRQEIQKIVSFTTYKQLISKGLTPGQDFSMDGNGRLLQKLSQQAEYL